MPSANRDPQSRAPRKTASPSSNLPEVVDPVWLVKALVLTLLAALACVYLAVCLLFYQGTWQLVLNPSRTVDRTPASAGLSFTPVRFGDFDTGAPHLTGWWIPSSQTPEAYPARLNTAPPSFTSRLTVLYLHGGSGSLSDTLPTLTLLHNVGLNVFAIDYRGFGLSDPSKHPDAHRMQQDADAALDYLTSTRHIPTSSIIPMGSALGAAIAVHLVQNHPELPALVLDNPDPDPAATAAAAHPSRLIPVHLLFGDRFHIAEPLATLSTPKLLIASANPDTRLTDLFHRAADPKYSVTLPPTHAEAPLQDALRRFLDQYVTQH